MASPGKKLICSLIELDKVKASLFSAAKKQPSEESQETIKTSRSNVKSLIPIILKEFEHVQLPTFFPEKAIPRILDKIQATLGEFKKFNPENAFDYDRLVKEVNECKSRINTSPSSDLPRHSESPTGDSAQLEGSTADNPQPDQFNGLTDPEKKCLFCFCLFSAEVEVKKREPIHLWVAMGLVADPLDGANMLAKLVAEGYIKRSVRNKKLCNGYKMNQTVHSMVVDAMNIRFAKDVTALSVMDRQEQPPPSPQPNRILNTVLGNNEGVVGGLETLVLNKSENNLQATTFEQIFKMKNNIKVLNLGNWQHNPDRNIVVEVEALKGLTKNIGEVTLLSLEGISGIVELPSFIYKLEKLKVLDLRGCPNLEFLSKGIGLMKQLTHLDLSECYLLDHFPKGIASLTGLRVLKGFVVNPEDSLEGDVNRNRNKNSLRASFRDLKALEKLIKLTVRTRRNFPTSDDFDTLCAMKKLANLKISWAWNSSDDLDESAPGSFPASLKKLELQATPKSTMWRLLRLISNDTRSCLQELYIRGGQMCELDVEMYQIHHVQTVRLRYLADLQIEWNEFKTYFPELTRLEVFKCPNLVFFPYDENGIWTKYRPINMVS